MVGAESTQTCNLAVNNKYDCLKLHHVRYLIKYKGMSHLKITDLLPPLSSAGIKNVQLYLPVLKYRDKLTAFNRGKEVQSSAKRNIYILFQMYRLQVSA
jgi:hypothetical protein